MPRPKYSAAYPMAFKDILVRVGRDMECVTLDCPTGYKIASLRATFYAYFRAVIQEGEKAGFGTEEYALGQMAKKCVIRIKGDKLELANRENDVFAQSIMESLNKIGFKPVDYTDPNDAILPPEPVNIGPLKVPPLSTPAQSTPEPAGCDACGGYGCEKCEAGDSKPVESKKDILDPNQQVKDLTAKWLGKGK